MTFVDAEKMHDDKVFIRGNSSPRCITSRPSLSPKTKATDSS